MKLQPRLMQQAASTLKHVLQDILQSFHRENFREAALAFFKAIGYSSSRTIFIKSVSEFRAEFDTSKVLQKKGARISQWKQIELLFQLTDEDLQADTKSAQTNGLNPKRHNSYLFFGLELSSNLGYKRTALVEIAKSLNRVFPMPVMVLFKMGGKLTLVILNRRIRKRDITRDVLQDAIVHCEININNPEQDVHLLEQLALTSLRKRYAISCIDDLHLALALMLAESNRYKLPRFNDQTNHVLQRKPDIRNMFLRVLQEGSIPDEMVQKITAFGSEEKNYEFEQKLRQVINDLGGETDERFEYVSTDDDFRVFLSGSPSFTEETLVMTLPR